MVENKSVQQCFLSGSDDSATGEKIWAAENSTTSIPVPVRQFDLFSVIVTVTGELSGAFELMSSNEGANTPNSLAGNFLSTCNPLLSESMAPTRFVSIPGTMTQVENNGSGEAHFFAKVTDLCAETVALKWTHSSSSLDSVPSLTASYVAKG